MDRFDFTQLAENSHIHFIGIGGISMSGLAMILLKKGYKVTGSDRQKSHITDKLEKSGAIIFEGHKKENITGADLVVYTAAVHDDNPEIQEAKKQNIELIDRAECLGAIMKQYKNAVGISGTHGKTTTTAMLTHALVYAKKDPTISVGGELDLIDGNIKTGNTDYFVTEACEYTNSFLKFYPYVAVITNIEEDHLDFFSGIDEIKKSFNSFANLTRNTGYVVLNNDDKNPVDAIDKDLDIITYGKDNKSDYYCYNVVINKGYPEFDVMYKGELKCHIKLNVAGMHNVLNALSVIAVCEIFGVDAKIAACGIETFKGIHRRFEKLGELNGANIIADYAHHPTEIIATIKACNDFSYNKLWCVFQPHTYTRTKALWNDFLNCFKGTDELIITHIYAAREKFDGVTKASVLAEEISKKGMLCRYIEEFDEICEYLKMNVKKDDMVLIMGAGDVIKIGEEIV